MKVFEKIQIRREVTYKVFDPYLHEGYLRKEKQGMGAEGWASALRESSEPRFLFEEKRDWDMFGSVAFEQDTVLDLVAMTVADLGFPGGATNAQIWEKRHALGLELCPPEAAFVLRFEYKRQPQGEWLTMVMEPFVDKDGDQCIACITRVPEFHLFGVHFNLRLFAYDWKPDTFHIPSEKHFFVFAKQCADC